MVCFYRNKRFMVRKFTIKAVQATKWMPKML